VSVDYDRQTLAVMERYLRSDSNCVDVGCHAGLILKEMVRLAPAGSHYAFEPIPELGRALAESYPQVRVLNLALSDSESEAVFHHVLTNPGYSGLRKRRYDRPGEVIEEIQVQTALLDDLLPGGFRVDFMKIDVEGAELNVLRGAFQTIKRCRPAIVFEHGLGASEFYDDAPPERVYELLNAVCGMQISLMEDWLAERPALTRDAFLEQFYTGANYYFMAHG